MEADDSPQRSEDADAERPPPLVGVVGSNFISAALSAKGVKPQEALAQVRERGALKNPACAPLMAMLELQGVPASTAHKRLLHDVRSGTS
jgi:hypothetical protein